MLTKQFWFITHDNLFYICGFHPESVSLISRTFLCILQSTRLNPFPVTLVMNHLPLWVCFRPRQYHCTQEFYVTGTLPITRFSSVLCNSQAHWLDQQFLNYFLDLIHEAINFKAGFVWVAKSYHYWGTLSFLVWACFTLFRTCFIINFDAGVSRWVWQSLKEVVAFDGLIFGS